MSEKKDLTDEEISKLSVNILNALRPIVEKISEESIPKRINKKEQQEIGNILRYFQNMGNISTELNSATLPKDFKTKQQFLLADKFLSDMFGLQSQNPVEEIIDNLNPKIAYDKICSDVEFNKKFQNCIHQIFYEMEKSGRLQKFSELIHSMGLDYAFASIQSAERLNKKISYVLKSRKQFTRRIIDNYIESYKEVTGFIELPIRILYGMLLILHDQYKEFSQIKKIPIGAIMDILKKEKLFSFLIETYDPHIRNSIIHETYPMNFAKREIDFIDNKEQTKMSFEKFVIHVQDITRRAIMLSRIEFELQYLQYLGYKEQRAKIIKN